MAVTVPERARIRLGGVAWSAAALLVAAIATAEGVKLAGTLSVKLALVLPFGILAGLVAVVGAFARPRATFAIASPVVGRRAHRAGAHGRALHPPDPRRDAQGGVRLRPRVPVPIAVILASVTVTLFSIASAVSLSVALRFEAITIFPRQSCAVWLTHAFQDRDLHPPGRTRLAIWCAVASSVVSVVALENCRLPGGSLVTYADERAMGLFEDTTFFGPILGFRDGDPARGDRAAEAAAGERGATSCSCSWEASSSPTRGRPGSTSRMLADMLALRCATAAGGPSAACSACSSRPGSPRSSCSSRRGPRPLREPVEAAGVRQHALRQPGPARSPSQRPGFSATGQARRRSSSSRARTPCGRTDLRVGRGRHRPPDRALRRGACCARYAMCSATATCTGWAVPSLSVLVRSSAEQRRGRHAALRHASIVAALIWLGAVTRMKSPPRRMPREGAPSTTSPPPAARDAGRRVLAGCGSGTSATSSRLLDARPAGAGRGRQQMRATWRSRTVASTARAGAELRLAVRPLDPLPHAHDRDRGRARRHRRAPAAPRHDRRSARRRRLCKHRLRAGPPRRQLHRRRRRARRMVALSTTPRGVLRGLVPVGRRRAGAARAPCWSTTTSTARSWRPRRALPGTPSSNASRIWPAGTSCVPSPSRFPTAAVAHRPPPGSGSGRRTSPRRRTPCAARCRRAVTRSAPMAGRCACRRGGSRSRRWFGSGVRLIGAGHGRRRRSSPRRRPTRTPWR